jgi:hypothetical protein
MDAFRSEWFALAAEMIRDDEAVTEEEALSRAYFAMPGLLQRGDAWDARSLLERVRVLEKRCYQLEMRVNEMGWEMAG